MKNKIIKNVDSHVIKILGDGNRKGGWGPAGINANPVEVKNATFSFTIEENDNGFLLSCASIGGEMYDDWLFDSLEEAEDRANEIYGITSEQWSI